MTKVQWVLRANRAPTVLMDHRATRDLPDRLVRMVRRACRVIQVQRVLRVFRASKDYRETPGQTALPVLMEHKDRRAR